MLVSGIDKYLVGQTAAIIRAIKPPVNRTKDKGIKYTGEYVPSKSREGRKKQWVLNKGVYMAVEQQRRQLRQKRKSKHSCKT